MTPEEFIESMRLLDDMAMRAFEQRNEAFARLQQRILIEIVNILPQSGAAYGRIFNEWFTGDTSQSGVEADPGQTSAEGTGSHREGATGNTTEKPA